MKRINKILLTSLSLVATTSIPTISSISCSTLPIRTYDVVLNGSDASLVHISNTNVEKGKTFSTKLFSKDTIKNVIRISSVTINGADATNKYTYNTNTHEFQIRGEYVIGRIVITPSLIYSLPKVDIIGDISQLTKDDEKKLSIKYQEQDGMNLDLDILIKLQGNSSVDYAKKNYNIKLFEKGSDYQDKAKIQFQYNWKKDHKYTLKANYVDAIGIHNIVTCKLWGDVIHQRHHIDKLDRLINGGAIDGFPIACYNNDQFLGLYTWNLKKHEDLFGMSSDETKHEAMLLGNWKKEKVPPPNYEFVYFKRPIEVLDQDGFNLEFCSTQSTQWVKTSFNNFINFIINVSDKTTFLNEINTYTNLNVLIDYFVFIGLICGWDSIGNNIMWVTYDGQHWTPSIYDQEYTFGFWNNSQLYPYDYDFSTYTSQSNLFNKLNTYCADQIKEAWNVLKIQALSLNHILKTINDAWTKVTPELYAQEIAKWSADHRRIQLNTINNMLTWITERVKYYLKSGIIW